MTDLLRHLTEEPWSSFWVGLWYAVLAAIVLILVVDAVVAVWGGPSTPTLTQVIVSRVPWWLTMPLLIWLVAHFSLRYLDIWHLPVLRFWR